jgi:hypothetical protein
LPYFATETRHPALKGGQMSVDETLISQIKLNASLMEGIERLQKRLDEKIPNFNTRITELETKVKFLQKNSLRTCGDCGHLRRNGYALECGIHTCIMAPDMWQQEPACGAFKPKKEES